jgi:hypothetical protein
LKRHRTCLARLRRAFLTATVGVFALLQAVAPLLHTHVSASLASAQTGIHLPVTLVHEGHGHGNANLSDAVALDESDAIITQPEHRRDETPAHGQAADAPASFATRSPPSSLSPAYVAALRSVPPYRRLPQPPSQAPPAFA